MRSPFTGMHLAGLEFKNIINNKVIALAICGVALIPLVYGGLFLSAFFDPYGSLDKVPAVVVNLDRGATIAGEETNIGDLLCDSLEENLANKEEGQAAGFDWHYTDSVEEARAGLDDATYYMMLVIPEDFSEQVASADSANPESAELEAYFNPSTNMIASTVGQSMVTSIKAQLSQSIQQQYYENIFFKLSDATDSLQLATDGANELSDGLESAAQGSDTITTNLATLAAGAQELSDGLDTMETQVASALKPGTESLASGAAEVSSGLATLNTKTASLASGVSQLSAGASSLVAGLNSLSSGVTKAAAGAQSVEDGLVTLKTSLGTAQSGAESYETGITSMYKLLKSTGMLYLLTSSQRSQLAQLYAAASKGELSSGLGTAVLALGTATDTNTLIGGTAAIASGLGQAQAGLGTSADTSTLIGGATAIKSGLSTLDASVPALTSGVSQLADGAAQVSDGAASVDEGVGSLASGISSAVAGASEIASGASQLYDGSSTLTVGLKDAEAGSSELASGLAEGTENLAESTENADQKSEMMSEPVTANGETEHGETITTVKNYGTGFAPYFIGLAMWVGALMLSMLLRSLNGRALMSKASSIAAVLSSYIPMMVLSVVQGFILLLFLQFVLGFNVNYPVQFYLFSVLVSMAFTAIIQFCRASMGTVGMVVVVILLMLQLCTAGGTFPVEASPAFFGAISPYMPMTYVVQGFRVAMCGLSTSYMVEPAIVLACFAAGFIALTTVVAHRKRVVSLATLNPPIKMAA